MPVLLYCGRDDFVALNFFVSNNTYNNALTEVCPSYLSSLGLLLATTDGRCSEAYVGSFISEIIQYYFAMCG